MNKTEFLDLLRYYFRNAKKSEVEEILADYEAHFEEGKKRGLTEEAIAKELGSPKDIYESYASEGVVDEKSKSVRFTDDAKEAAQEAAATAARKAGKAWDMKHAAANCVLRFADLGEEYEKVARMALRGVFDV